MKHSMVDLLGNKVSVLSKGEKFANSENVADVGIRYVATDDNGNLAYEVKNFHKPKKEGEKSNGGSYRFTLIIAHNGYPTIAGNGAIPAGEGASIVGSFSVAENAVRHFMKIGVPATAKPSSIASKAKQ